jgi:hypothetical protein
VRLDLAKHLEVRRYDGRWVVLYEGEVRSRHSTQQEAIEAARLLARANDWDLTWRDRKGAKQGRASYRLFWRWLWNSLFRQPKPSTVRKRDLEASSANKAP